MRALIDQFYPEREITMTSSDPHLWQCPCTNSCAWALPKGFRGQRCKFKVVNRRINLHCLDYCNSLLYGVFDGLMRKLQSIQSAVSRLITGTRRCDHITHVLRQLHWLPVRRRVDYKIACLVHQSLSGLAPAYLADDVNLVAESGRCLLRSASDRTCCPHTHNIFGDRSFAAFQWVWNNLPSQL